MTSDSTRPPSLRFTHLWPVADRMDLSGGPACPGCGARAKATSEFTITDHDPAFIAEHSSGVESCSVCRRIIRFTIVLSPPGMLDEQEVV